MKVDFLQEPELEFGTDRHIDIRFGLMHYGPLDYASPLAPKHIRLGVVGTTQTLEGLCGWLDKCRDGIEAKESRQPNLFPRFPGCGPDVSFRTSLTYPAELQRALPQNDLNALIKAAKTRSVVAEAVQLFLNEFEYLVQNYTVDVLVCAIPVELLNAIEGKVKSPSGSSKDEGGAGIALNFHHLLKAQAMGLKRPVQIILPGTYDETMLPKQKRRADQPKTTQDEATRAWNFHTALYYKAGGVPWRLIRDPSQYTVCYIGISFFKTLDGSKLLTSVAQVFNQRGEGVVVRGGAAQVSKEDRQPHLQAKDAHQLLKDAIARYRETHQTLPARIVLHKSSFFNEAEEDGFAQAAKELGINLFDFLSIGDSYMRLFRVGLYPPLRGTLFSLDSQSHVLYTRGSVDFFNTYPGMYIPLPRHIRCAQTVETPKFLAQEVLALTKMNWNNTQYDGGEPITLRAAHQVSGILKYIDEGDHIEPRYSFYM